MKKLNQEVNSLKEKYREIFLKTGDEIREKLENKSPIEKLKYLNEDLVKEVSSRKDFIFESRKKYNCAGCASCCKLACSEFSPDELKNKASNGDNFAQQFLSVFAPYTDEKDAQKAYPQYFELIKQQGQYENVYFYHCPKVTIENRCPDYENRPQICRDFPDNPIGFLPKLCAFEDWKKETENVALEMRAIAEITEWIKG